MISLPTIRQLQFLLALKQKGSFHAAATACGVTQSTLSAGIQEMEEILQQKAIDRTHRRNLTFTPLGLELLERSNSIVNSLSDVAGRARQSDKPFSWPLRLGMIPTIAPYLLPDILAPLKKDFPQLVLHIHEVQSAELVAKVRAGDLDAGIMAFPFETPDLHQSVLTEEKFICAVPRHMFPDHKNLSLKDISTQDLLLLSEGHCLRAHALAACGLKQVNSNQETFSATSLATIIQLVANGYGLTLLPQMAAKSLYLPKSVHLLPFIPTATRQIGLIWRLNTPLKKDLELLYKALKKIFVG
jgi:LysR family hydrogen peroxide-inducible transcriptional activator